MQEGELLSECDCLYEQGDPELVIDYLMDFDDYDYDDEDIAVDEPYIVRNGTDERCEKDGYVLLHNSTIGGVFLLYREANEREVEYFYDNAL